MTSEEFRQIDKMAKEIYKFERGPELVDPYLPEKASTCKKHRKNHYNKPAKYH